MKLRNKLELKILMITQSLTRDEKFHLLLMTVTPSLERLVAN